MKSLSIQFLLLVLPLLALGLPYGSLEDLYNPEYNYDEDNEVSEEKAVMKPPGFKSETMNLVVNEGETITLPCIVTRLQGFVLLWKKNDNIITVGDQILGIDDSRYYLEAKENGNNLVISLAEPGDEGEYVCQVSAFKPTEIHHSVKIRVRPTIQTSPVKSLTVKEGEEARLYCRVLTGHPTPRLKWRKKGGTMPTGDQEIMGEDIIFESVSRHFEGTYECHAEDDYGSPPVTSEVQLYVEYAPVIEQEQTYINTAAGDEIHVTCIVHGYPEPQVVWEKDGQIIKENSNGFVINRSGDRHNLILLDVDNEFFGEYSCQARNALGVVTKSTQVSGENTDNSDLAYERQKTYPKLDIRNFYLESFGESGEGSVKIDDKFSKLDKTNIEGLRIFAYTSNLGNKKIPYKYAKNVEESKASDGFEVENTNTLMSVGGNKKTDRLQTSSEVTDMQEDKDMTSSFRGSFSEHSDLNEMNNIYNENNIKTFKDDKLEDIGVEWKHVPLYSLHANQIAKEKASHDDEDDENSKEASRENADVHPFFHVNLDKTVHYESTEDVLSAEKPQRPSLEMKTSYRGSFSKDYDLDDIIELENGEKTSIAMENYPVHEHSEIFTNNRYLNIYEGSSMKATHSDSVDGQTEEGIENTSGEEDGSFEEGSTFIFNPIHEKLTSEKIEKDMLARIASYSSERTDDMTEQNPGLGGMFLTTSIVSEHIGENSLETTSPYEKPFNRKPVPKEHIFDEDAVRPYPIDISEFETEAQASEFEEDHNTSPIMVHSDKQTIEETEAFQDESISPLMVHHTAEIETTSNENIEETHHDKKSPVIAYHFKSEEARDSETMDMSNAKEEETIVEDKFEDVKEESEHIYKPENESVQGTKQELAHDILRSTHESAETHFDQEYVEMTTQKEDNHFEVHSSFEGVALNEKDGSKDEHDKEYENASIIESEIESITESEDEHITDSKFEYITESADDYIPDSDYEYGIKYEDEYIAESEDKFRSEMQNIDESVELSEEIGAAVQYTNKHNDVHEKAAYDTENQVKFEEETIPESKDEFGTELHNTVQSAVNYEDDHKAVSGKAESDTVNHEEDESVVEYNDEDKGELDTVHQEESEVAFTVHGGETDNEETQADHHEENLDLNDQDIKILEYESEAESFSKYNEDHTKKDTDTSDDQEKELIDDQENDTTDDQESETTDDQGKETTDDQENKTTYDQELDNNAPLEATSYEAGQTNVLEDYHELNKESGIEENIEDQTDDYIDYSYADMAAQKKITGNEDNEVLTIKIRKEKPKKDNPWLKKFKFVMVGNKVVMVLRKA